MDNEKYNRGGVDIYIENIDDILSKVNSLIGDGNDTSGMLNNAAGKYTIVGIKPRELLNNGAGVIPDYTVPSDLKNLNGTFLQCLGEIKSYFDKVYAIENGSSPSVGGWNVGDISQDSGGGNTGSGGGVFNPIPGKNPSDNGVIVTPPIEVIPVDPNVSENDNDTSPTNGGSDGKVTETKPGDTTDDSNTVFKSSKNSGNLIVSEDGGKLVDENGNEIGNLQRGKYQVYEAKYDENGNLIAVRISKDGESQVWVNLTKNDANTVYIDASTKGAFQITNGTTNVYDENGNIIGKIGPGEHSVYGVIYDENGNAVAVRISKDGDPQCWLKLDDSSVNGQLVFDGQDGIYTLNGGNINIYDANGKMVGQLIDGKYVVYDVRCDNKGNVIAIRISKDGESEIWVNNYENGKYIGTYTPTLPIEDTIVLNNNSGKLNLFQKGAIATGGVIGVLAIAAGTKMYLKNKKGEEVSDIDEGEYNVFDVAQNDEGNVTDARITPNGEEEYWVHI